MKDWQVFGALLFGACIAIAALWSVTAELKAENAQLKQDLARAQSMWDSLTGEYDTLYIDNNIDSLFIFPQVAIRIRTGVSQDQVQFPVEEYIVDINKICQTK